MALDIHDVAAVLHEVGVFEDSVQARRLMREDLKKLIEENGGTAEYLDLRGLDMSSIDIRGMDLNGVWFQGCNLRNAFAQPLIVYKDKNLTPQDLAYGLALAELQAGENPKNCEVKCTNLESAFLAGADLSKGDFRWAKLSDANLEWGKLDDANFSCADMSNSVLTQVSLERTDLRSVILDKSSLGNSRIIDANLSGSSLRGVLLEGAFISPLTKLDGVTWDANLINRLELDGDYRSAARQYRDLKEWHDRVGMRDIAGAFHYREREAERKAEWDSIKHKFSSILHRIRHPVTEE